jgi:hypothetical protein
MIKMMVNNLKNTFNKQNTLITLSALLMCLSSVSLHAAKPASKTGAKPETGTREIEPGKAPTVFERNTVINPDTGKKVEAKSHKTTGSEADTTSVLPARSTLEKTGLSDKKVESEALNAAKEQNIVREAAQKFIQEAQKFTKKSNQDFLTDKDTVITKAATEEAEAALETLAVKVIKENGNKELPSNDRAHEGMGAFELLVAEVIQKDVINKGKEPSVDDRINAVNKASDIYLKMKILGTNDPKELEKPLTKEQEERIKKEREEFCKCTGTCAI